MLGPVKRNGSLNNRDFGLISDYGNTIALNWDAPARYKITRTDRPNVLLAWAAAPGNAGV